MLFARCSGVGPPSLSQRMTGSLRVMLVQRVGDQVLFGVAACGEDLEVLDAPLLPARFDAGRPLRIGGPVVPDVDRRRGALKDEELLRRCRQVGHTLNRGRSGADDTDPLVGQVFHVVPV